jgi:hypothetical protein
MRFGVLGPLPAQITGREVRLDGPRQAKMLAALFWRTRTTRFTWCYRALGSRWPLPGGVRAIL